MANLTAPQRQPAFSQFASIDMFTPLGPSVNRPGVLVPEEELLPHRIPDVAADALDRLHGGFVQLKIARGEDLGQLIFVRRADDR